MSLTFAAREWGWVHFSIPQRKRQTAKVWAHHYGFVIASAMWGIDIGFGFATYVRTGGYWVLVMLAFVVADPFYGATLLLAYWLGRALTVWLAPIMIPPSSDADDLPIVIEGGSPLLGRLAGFSLAWSSIFVLAAILQAR
jgi:hypothetical protein